MNGVGIGMALYRLRLELTIQGLIQALAVLIAAAAGASTRSAALWATGTSTVLTTGMAILASAWLVGHRAA